MAHRWKVLVVTSSAVFMALLDVTIVNIAFPDLRRSFPTYSLADLSWIMNAYSVIFAAALVPAGRLADRVGHRKLFLIGVALFVAASVACGLAPSLQLLVAARVLQALGGALLTPTSLSLVLPEFPAEQRATATALWTATGAFAAAIGPSLGGVLVDWQGWRGVFFVNVLIGLPALIAAARLLRETRDESTPGWPDWIGAALLAAGVGALALVLVKGGDWGWGSGEVVTWSVVSVAAIGLFVLRSTSHHTPNIDYSLFTIRSFTMSNVGSFVFGIGFFAVLLCNVLFMTQVWGYSILQTGVANTPGPIMVTLTAPFAGRLADRFGQRAIAVPGGLLFAAGALFLSINTGATPNYWAEVFPAALLTGAGIGLTLPAFGSAAVAELPRHRFGTGIAISSLSRQIGGVVGIAVLVAILSSTTAADAVEPFHRGWLLIGLTGVLAAAAGAALGRVRARNVETTPRQQGSLT